MCVEGKVASLIGKRAEKSGGSCLPPRALDCTGRVNKDTHAGQARPPAPTQGSLSTPTGTGPREGDRDRMNAGVIPGWGSNVRGSEPGGTRRRGKGWWE